MSDVLAKKLTLPRYPRSAGYDPKWLIDHVMGPQPLWLMEWLRPAMELPAGARVLDLGCGTALSSIFLAREYDVRVTAADLWIKPTDNWERITSAGLADRITPVLAEAHELPFAEGYFDAIVSLDAYHYFGTDQLYLPYLARFLKPGGQLGVVAPGLLDELDGDAAPTHLTPYWNADFFTFHTPQWWRRLWTRSGALEVETADSLDEGWRDWLLWNEVCAQHSDNDHVREAAGQEADMLRIDAGRTLGFTRIVGRRPR